MWALRFEVSAFDRAVEFEFTELGGKDLLSDGRESATEFGVAFRASE